MRRLYTVHHREVGSIEPTEALREFLEQWKNESDGSYSLTWDDAIEALETMPEEDRTSEIGKFVSYLADLHDENPKTYDFTIF